MEVPTMRIGLQGQGGACGEDMPKHADATGKYEGSIERRPFKTIAVL